MENLGVDNHLRCMHCVVFELGGGGNSILVGEIVGWVVSLDLKGDEILVGEFAGDFARVLVDWRVYFGFVVLSGLTLGSRERVDQIVLTRRRLLHCDPLEETYSLDSTFEASHLARHLHPDQSQVVDAQ